MNESIRLAHFARYALRHAYKSESAEHAEAWRKAFSLSVRVLHRVQIGDISLERLAGLNEILDKLTRDAKADGGPGSGNHGHKGVPGQRGGSAPASGGSSNSGGSSPSSSEKQKNTASGGGTEVPSGTNESASLKKPLDYLNDTNVRALKSPYTGVIGGWGFKKDVDAYMRDNGASEETVKKVNDLFDGHRIGASKKPDKEIAHHMAENDDIGKALYSVSEFENACYEAWKEVHPDSDQLDKNKELKVYRKGNRVNGVECWTVNEEGADMGRGGIGYDHQSTFEQLQREGYVCVGGFGVHQGAPGESEITFVKPVKLEGYGKIKKISDLSDHDRKEYQKSIEQLIEKQRSLITAYQQGTEKAFQSGDFDAIAELGESLKKGNKEVQESVDAIADKYNIIVNVSADFGNIKSSNAHQEL